MLYPALTPSARERASGTHWANFATRLTALIIVVLCGMAVLERYGASCTSAAEAVRVISFTAGLLP
jgi:hypothetical protein